MWLPGIVGLWRAGGEDEAEGLEEGVAGGVESVCVWGWVAYGGYQEGEGFGHHEQGERFPRWRRVGNDGSMSVRRHDVGLNLQLLRRDHFAW